jgi:mono/diheme cytochrome c family protein
MPGMSNTYAFPAVRLGLRAIWELEITVRRAGMEDVAGTATIDTSQAAQPAPRLVEDEWGMPRLTLPAWAMGLFSFALFIGGLLALRRLPEMQPFASAIFLTMLVLITGGFAVQAYRLTIPVTAATGLENPVPADDSSIQRGSTLYTAYCLLCHGTAGAGVEELDDPEHQHDAADLTVRRVRLQRDGDLFHAISAGQGGTDMPAFDEALTDAERWDLVNYLRVLQAGAP